MSKFAGSNSVSNYSESSIPERLSVLPSKCRDGILNAVLKYLPHALPDQSRPDSNS